MKANYFVVLLLYIIVFESCKKESGDVDLKVEYDFSSTDKDLIPILNAYAESYIYGVTDWYNKNHYDLSAFNTIFAVGESNDALQNGYLFLSGSVPYDGDESNPIDLSVNLQATGSKAVRMNDPVLLIEATKDLKDGQVFTKYQKYLVFLVNNELIDGIERAGMASIIDFFYHEGYHLFPQENFKEPYAAHSGLRFNIPEDYPDDVESFTLILAGIKLTELVYQEQHQEKLKTYLKM